MVDYPNAGNNLCSEILGTALQFRFHGRRQLLNYLVKRLSTVTEML
jgi:hypothetical protein